MTDAQPKPGEPRKALWTAVKWVILLAVGVYVVRTIAQQLLSTSWRELTWDWLWMPLGALCVLAAKWSALTIYQSMLAAVGRPLPMKTVMPISWIPQLGKYIPGKVASVAGAIWLLNYYGVSGHLATMAVLLLTGINVSSGIVLAMPLTLVEPFRSQMPHAWLTCVALLFVILICLHPWILTRILSLGMRLARQGRMDVQLSIRRMIGPVVLNFLQWAALGLGMWMLAKTVSPVGVADIPIFIFGNALAMTLGFLAFFAPGGLGVREAILLQIFTPLLGNGAAIVIVAMRLLQTIFEVVLAVAGIAIFKSVRRKIDSPA